MIRKSIQSDDRAVSPVIATILMVSITVVLAAIIGTYVLDIGEETQVAPQASFSCEGGITHEAGDTMSQQYLYSAASPSSSLDLTAVGDNDKQFESGETLSISRLIYKKGGESYVLKDCT